MLCSQHSFYVLVWRVLMISFAIAVFLLIITPGPGVLSTAGVGSAFGYRAGISYVSGLCVGTNLVCVAVVTGLATILFSLPILREILIVLSSFYLLYLALRIGFAGANIAFITSAKPPGFFSGIFLQFVNPKAYAVNTALFTGFAFDGVSFTTEIGLKFLIMNTVWVPLHLIWLYAGVKLNQLNLSHRTTRTINLGMALCLAAVVALSLFSLMQIEG